MANKDLLGYRQTVYSREFEGKEWVLNHSLAEDNYMFFCTDENFNTILPEEARKTGVGQLTVQFPVFVTGNASVFRLTPLLNFQIVEVNNQSSITFIHKYYIPHFIVQSWDSENNLVLPKNIKKDEYECTVDFYKNFTGVINCVYITQEVKDYLNVNNWIYSHRQKTPRGHMLLQSDDENLEVMLPLEEKRIGGNSSYSSNRYVELNWGKGRTGTLSSIINGYRI